MLTDAMRPACTATDTWTSPRRLVPVPENVPSLKPAATAAAALRAGAVALGGTFRAYAVDQAQWNPRARRHHEIGCAILPRPGLGLGNLGGLGGQAFGQAAAENLAEQLSKMPSGLSFPPPNSGPQGNVPAAFRGGGKRKKK